MINPFWEYPWIMLAPLMYTIAKIKLSGDLEKDV